MLAKKCLSIVLFAAVASAPCLAQDGDRPRTGDAPREADRPRVPDAGSQPRSPNPAAGQTAPARRTLIQRVPLYSHAPGISGIIGWKLVYSDGFEETIYTGGGSSGQRPTTESPAGGTRTGAAGNAVEYATPGGSSGNRASTGSSGQRPTAESQTGGAAGNAVEYATRPSAESSMVSIEGLRAKQAELTTRKAQIFEREQNYNVAVQAARGNFDDAERDASAARRSLIVEKTNLMIAESKWSISNFSYCPEGNRWGDCSHEEEKQQWRDDRDLELAPIEAEIARLESEEKDADSRKKKEADKIDGLKKERDTRKADNDAYKKDLIEYKREASQLWLSPGGKPPIHIEKMPTPPAQGGARIIYDDSVPKP